MLFSALIALMTGAAIFAVLMPLSRRVARAESARAADVAVYRDQLVEIERDVARGLIAAPEAEAAKIEVSRRLLAAAAADQAGAPAAGAEFRRRAASVLALAGIPLIAVGFYFSLGSPDLPGAPLAARLALPLEQQDPLMLVHRIEGHLAQNPNDGRGWQILAPIYLRMGRIEDAEQAYRRAMTLLAPAPPLESDLGEVLVILAKGLVTPEARDYFERALAIDPKHGKALFYLGLAAEQAGKADEARGFWTRIAADDPWALIAKRRLEQLGSVK